ncbi:MAG: hypothetical protein QJR03_09955 [Sphaerobacter sp.]|nr:hypothetical protein [Sphaerobacter sp.]
MQTSVRYSVINQDGRPVIRAVPVPSRLHESLAQAAAREERVERAPETRSQDEPILRRIRRLRLLDIR